MEAVGINVGLLVAQLVNLGLLVAWIALALVALRSLRAAELSLGQQLGWTALILLVPLLGALAALILRPGRRTA